ncbi:MAG: GGDEF domain-containing protein [Chloroflexota bacterium]
MFTDLAVAMAGLGLLVGLAFPPVAVGLGVSPAHAFRPSFMGACLISGVIVGGVGWWLCQRIVGRQIALLASRTELVAGVVANASLSGDWTDCDPERCRILLDSDDELGNAASAFNALLKELAGMHEVQERLQHLTAGLLEHTGLDEVSKWALGQVSTGSGTLAGAILLVEGGEPRVLASRGFRDPDALLSSVTVAEALAGRVPVVVSLPEDLVTDGVIASVRPREVFVLPLRLQSAPIGALLLAFDHHTSATERGLLEIEVRPVSLALHNASSRSALEALAAQDHLTGLLNRRFGEIRLAEEFARSVRAVSPLGVIMFDIDRFKVVNDTYGHLVGDRVLKAVAAIGARMVRQGDALARFGGEEFLGLLPGADVADSVEVAERIRMGVNGSPVHIGGLSLAVSVSVGVVSWPEVEATTPTSLIRFADDAMYRAKQAGRNRVEVAMAPIAGQQGVA